MFYDGWYGLVRVVIVGTCAYLTLIALLRISGKRTLAKPNAFDFVIALGSTLASAPRSPRLSSRQERVERAARDPSETGEQAPERPSRPVLGAAPALRRSRPD